MRLRSNVICPLPWLALSALLSMFFGSAHASGASASGKRAASQPRKLARATTPPKGVDHRSLTDFLARPWDTDLLSAAQALQRNVATSPGAVDEVHVSGTTKLSVSPPDSNDPAPVKISTAGQLRAATVADLRRLGINSVAELQAKLRARVRPYFKQQGHVLPRNYEALADTVQSEADRLAMHAFDFPRRPDAQLLLAHHREVLGVKDPVEWEFFDEGGDDRLVFHGASQGNEVLSILDGNTLRPATHGDLVRIGLGTDAAMNTALERHLVRVAGIKGSAKDPRVVKKARQALIAQIEEKREFAQLLAEPQGNDEFSELSDWLDSQKFDSLVIRAKGPVSLKIVKYEPLANIPGYYIHYFALFDKRGEKLHVENPADLLPVDIADTTTLKAAFVQTLAKLKLKGK